MTKLDIVIPVYDEALNLPELLRRITTVLDPLEDTEFSYSLIFVDDGSRDKTAALVRAAAATDSRIQLLTLSRNFGHEAASTCGLDHAHGDAVVLIDADLQDPPELIPQMLARWRDGAAVVYGRRRLRDGESWLKRSTAHLFYRLLQRVSEVPIPPDTGDFRLMDRRVVEVLRRCRENPRFVRGLVSWAGFRQEAILYDRDARFAGHTKYRPWALLKLSFIAISAFSLIPLRIAAYLGGLVIIFSLSFAIYIAASRILRNELMPWQGYALLTCAVLFLGGVQLIMLGVVAYYIGLIFQHTRHRPLYVLDPQGSILAPAALNSPSNSPGSPRGRAVTLEGQSPFIKVRLEP